MPAPTPPVAGCPNVSQRLETERAWLAICFGAIVIGTLAPFEFSLEQPGLSERTREALRFHPWASLQDFPLHFTGFGALGLFIAGVYGTRLKRFRPAPVLFAALAACATLDLAQLALPVRHARLSDVVTNAAGLCFGLWSFVYTARGTRMLAAIQTAARRRARWIGGVVILTSVLAWTSVSLQPAFGSLRLGWDPSFHLLIGNEIDPPRPWLGELRYVRVYGRGLSAGEIRRLHEKAAQTTSAPPAVAGDLLVGYDFRQAPANPLPSSGTLADVDLALTVPDEIARSDTGGAIFDRPATMVSGGAAAELTQAVAASGAFSVEVWFRPANLDQAGPARLVSLSDGWRKRNFMLGQDGRDLVFRVRNRVNGLSGSPYALHAADIVDLEWQHVVAVYDHGVSALYKNGRRTAESVDLLEPAFYFPLGGGQKGWITIATLLVLTVAVPLFLLLGPMRGTKRHALVLSLTFAIGGTPYVISCLAVGGTLRIDFFAWLAIATAGAYAAAVAYVFRPAGTGGARINRPGRIHFSPTRT